jgi:hypothetical protein
MKVSLSGAGIIVPAANHVRRIQPPPQDHLQINLGAILLFLRCAAET